VSSGAVDDRWLAGPVVPGSIDRAGVPASVGYKLRPPPLRPGLVPRTRLISRLTTVPQPYVVTIVAPPGYGKTTLLTQWKDTAPGPTAWLSVDGADNDPTTLLTDIVAALRHAGMLPEPAVLKPRLYSEPVIPHGVARLAQLLESAGAAGVLILDQVNNLRSRSATDIVAEFAVRLPPAVQLVLASQASVRLPTAVLRAQRMLHEFTASDLAMNEAEGQALLQHLGIDVGQELGELTRRTEGWPVGIYLVGLTVKSGRRPALQIGGNDRLLADYLRHEVLDRRSDNLTTFLTRTSILERFCGPLCDAVLETTDSGRTIERLERSNLLIVPLDNTNDWYRYHYLLEEFLSSELNRREPELVKELHVRAAKWFDAHDIPELAVRHAQAADDVALVARIMARVTRRSFALGKVGSVVEWLRWFEHDNRIVGYPDIAALGALVFALSGNKAAADRWAGVLFAGVDPGGSTGLSPVARLLLAIRGRGGIAQMRADARAARLDLRSEPEWLAGALAAEGFSHLWDGDAEHAETLFAQAISAGDWFLGIPAVTLSLTAQAIIAIGRDDWDAADRFVTRALGLVEEHGLERYPTSAMSFAVATRCAIRRHEIGEARRLLARAANIRPQLTAAIPGISVQALLELVQAHRELSDAAGARVVLREAATILAGRYDLGRLPDQYKEIKARLDKLTVSSVGVTALTAAELRVLPYLATHLSFNEIGERLFVSRHTVKTQAMSIYRKLGASSRSEAVQRAAEAGFLAA
jgi:LuxR family transcriptional regulator, maltose regulon positive regulatory protein